MRSQALRLPGAALRPAAWARDVNPLSYRLWVAGAALLAVGLGFVLSGHPFLATGMVGGTLVLMVLLLRPMLLVAATLAVGAVNLAFLTGGEKELLDAMGGLDMNGIRLIGLVGGLAGLVLIDRRMLEATLGPHGRWYLLFLVYAGGTAFLSPAPLEGMRLLFKLAYPFLVFAAVQALTREEAQLDALGSWTLAASAVLVFLVNPVLVILGGYTVDDSGHLRLQGLGMHQNAFAYYLLAMSFLAMARYFVRGQRRYLLLALGMAGWIVLTLSRITLLAVVLGLGAMALYAAVARRTVKPLVGAVIVAAAVAVPLTPMVFERTLGFVPGPGELVTLLSDPGALARDMRWNGRDAIWPALLAAYRQSPVVGLGIGASGPVLRTSFSSGVTDIPHNEYLRVGVETGVIGLLLLAAALLAWWLGAARAGLRGGGLAREYGVAAVGIIMAAIIISMTGNTIDYYTQLTQYIGFFVGAALTAAAFAREESELPEAQPVAAEGAS